VEVKEQYQLKISNRFSALEDFNDDYDDEDDDMDINRAGRNTRENKSFRHR
jgi:hypothetical protein